jgi:RimJ/RimL family protein N-acetyltransferase
VTSATVAARFAPYVLGVDLHLLHDGTEVEIRPIRPDDAERLQVSHARLSPESRFRRYLSAKPTLSAADARYLAELDGSDHFALVATVTATAVATGGEASYEDGAIIAVARYIRHPADLQTAEFAIVVDDGYHRQGLATELLGRLAAIAAGRGVYRFRASMLADNVPIRRLLDRLSTGRLVERRFGSVTEVEVELPEQGRFRRSGTPAIIGPCAGS